MSIRAIAFAATLALTMIAPAAASAAPDTTAPAAGSDYLAGLDQGTKFKKAVIKRFVVPELDCTGETAGIELGVGYEPTEGKREYLAAVVVACAEGQPYYRTHVMVGGTEDSSPAVAAGDVITAKLTLQGGRLTATLTNRTEPAGSVSVTAGVESAAGVTYGAFPVAAGGGRLPVPDFGKVRMKHTSAAAGSIKLDRLGDPGIKTKKQRKGAADALLPPGNETFTLRHVVHCCIL